MTMTLGPSHIGYYNTVHAGKAWEIRAVVIPEGAVFCADCARFFAHDDGRLSPVFASDDCDMVCDKCREEC